MITTCMCIHLSGDSEGTQGWDDRWVVQMFDSTQVTNYRSFLGQELQSGMGRQMGCPGT